MSVRNSACAWPTAHCGSARTGENTCSALASLNPTVAQLIEDAATGFLWRWSGRKYGLCEVTVRPCREDCGDRRSTYRGRSRLTSNVPYYGDFGWGGLNPAMIGGEWFNLDCGSCSGDKCSCTHVEQVQLPGPVDSITRIYDNGSLLPPTSYRVDNGSVLVRIDGERWPRCQEMQKNPLSDPDTFQVTYQMGEPVPAGGQLAAGVLACEMAKAACGDEECRLPQRVQTITRQGVSMHLLDSFADLYKNGTVGIFLVDNWIASERADSRGGSAIISPDFGRTRRTTWSSS